ncbi:MAG: tRNA (adenosine(37)-N6)-dimethylallyltransferase MiaA [Epulopiscium sp. Nele67-Bin005]|nr:MAG: tRNA (adenosine(37)-N6)-dimethylallyltransferase MiaA [Epulopiscium sp. Nele67-Bin005]
MNKPLILIAGPTASGKTDISINLAKRLNGEIICIDSMQIYKQMDIGTAKISQDEMDGVPHYMIDELEPTEGSNIAWFKERVTQYINEIHARNKIPILVGGTGFYINAILYDTQFEDNEQDTKRRQELFEFAYKNGSEALYAKLQEIDPEGAKPLHPNNLRRVVRAIEYFEQTGKPISSHNSEQKEKRLNQKSPYNYCFFVLDMDRKILYERINLRVDMMMERGLLDEVKSLYNQGLTEDLTSMKAIGYKEFFPYFRGEVSLDFAVDKLKQNTRNYAKRQLTWFRHQTNPIWVRVDEHGFDTKNILEIMLNNVEETV